MSEARVTGQVRRKGGPGADVPAVLCLCLLIAAACASPASTSEPDPAASPAPARLSVAVLPVGASVLIDGASQGNTPLVLDLAPGDYRVRIERPGYQSLEQQVHLTAGGVASINGQLVNDTAAAVLNSPTPGALAPGVSRPAPTLTAPAASPTGRPSATPVAAGPTQAPTPLPGATPAPTASSPPTAPPSPTAPALPTASASPPRVTVRAGKVTIATYPYAAFTHPAHDAAFNVSYPALDRAAYDASARAPKDVEYGTLVVENEILRLTFIPELGGRLYEVFYKPTSHRATYRNPVLKPSPWGPPNQGGWLAAGGIEWCLPVEEHGYEWGVPWTADVSRDAAGATITLRDTAAGDRVRAAVAVRLEAGAASFTIRPRIENPTGSPVAIKYWTNAMLAPGGRDAPTSGLRFVLPESVTAVTVHSRGDDWLPGPDGRMPWPVANGVDLSRLGNWGRWLGFFEDPAAGEFMAVYDESYDEGMVRVFPPDVARGAKVFAFGWADPISPDNWTDGRSSYVEIHGGPASTFNDSVTLAPGGHLQWTETWYPVAGLGGLRYANSLAAVNLTATGGQIQAALSATRAWTGDAVILIDGVEGWRQRVSLLSGRPFRIEVAPGGAGMGAVTLQLQAPDGRVAAEYRTNLSW